MACFFCMGIMLRTAIPPALCQLQGPATTMQLLYRLPEQFSDLAPPVHAVRGRGLELRLQLRLDSRLDIERQARPDVRHYSSCLCILRPRPWLRRSDWCATLLLLQRRRLWLWRASCWQRGGRCNMTHCRGAVCGCELRRVGLRLHLERRYPSGLCGLSGVHVFQLQIAQSLAMGCSRCGRVKDSAHIRREALNCLSRGTHPGKASWGNGRGLTLNAGLCTFQNGTVTWCPQPRRVLYG